MATESALFDKLIVAYFVKQVSAFNSVLTSLSSDATRNQKNTDHTINCLHYFIFKLTPIHAQIYHVVS